MDEAHRLRTSQQRDRQDAEGGNGHAPKVLLTATPLQNSCWSCTAWSAHRRARVWRPAQLSRAVRRAGQPRHPGCAAACKRVHAPCAAGAALHLVHAAHPHGGALHAIGRRTNPAASSPTTCAALAQCPACGAAATDFAGVVEAAGLQQLRHCGALDTMAQPARPAQRRAHRPGRRQPGRATGQGLRVLDEIEEEWSRGGRRRARHVQGQLG
jgi:hypothetical protein